LYIEKYDEKLNKILGLLHENMVIDQTQYDRYNNLISARVRIYSDSSSVGTTNNILSTYKISCNSSGQGTFTS
jgi:UDP-N-acetylglucosamine 2-epimerase